MPTTDTQQMVDDCLSVLDIDVAHGGPGYDSWEKEFLSSVAAQFDDRGSLSPKQRDKLYELWMKI